MSKTLVAYFSCTGTTGRLAEDLASAVGADLHRIEPAEPYTAADLDWHDERSRSSVEMGNPSSRPAIAGTGPDLTDYTVVFLGSPIWWGVPPTIVNTFLESVDLSGKTVVPFVTSGSSPVGGTDARLRASCPDADLRPAIRFAANTSAQQLRRWSEQFLG
ncbi:MAG: flavodoxin [Propionibacteriaceae bacterium]|jgi:flavodoxin|nr:flavodoxin [Propionibacteriaceae bacterium]